MKILVRTEDDESWREFSSSIFQNEKELQILLSDSPSLIPLNDILGDDAELVYAVCEFPLPNGGRIDILGFTADGRIAVIECKLEANQESKRKVVGQILEYAAYLREITYEDINQKIDGKLADLVGNMLDNPDWSEDGFRAGVHQSLKSGSFILAIVVDDINDNLKKIIEYINSCANPQFSFHALEMNQFKLNDLSVLVPKLHGMPGDEAVLTNSGRVYARWTEEKIFQTINESFAENIVVICRKLFQWAKENADRIHFGSGGKLGSFTFHYLKKEKIISPFSLYRMVHCRLIMISYGIKRNVV